MMAGVIVHMSRQFDSARLVDGVGYLPATKDKCRGYVADYIDDGEADSVRADDALCLFPRGECWDVLRLWVRKLKHGGEISLSFPDSREIAKAFHQGTIEADEFDRYIHDGFESSHSVNEVANVLVEMGLKVLMKRVSGLVGYVTAERP